MMVCKLARETKVLGINFPPVSATNPTCLGDLIRAAAVGNQHIESEGLTAVKRPVDHVSEEHSVLISAMKTKPCK
jgi:hypothetical protein